MPLNVGARRHRERAKRDSKRAPRTNPKGCVSDVQAPSGAAAGADERVAGTQFTCFTGTKAQILTPEELRQSGWVLAHAEERQNAAVS